MLMPDVNILIYAHREDEKCHEAYAKWLKSLVDGAEPFALSVLVAVGFVRIVTNRRIYEDPTPPADCSRVYRAVDLAPPVSHSDTFRAPFGRGHTPLPRCFGNGQVSFRRAARSSRDFAGVHLGNARP